MGRYDLPALESRLVQNEVPGTPSQRAEQRLVSMKRYQEPINKNILAPASAVLLAGILPPLSSPGSGSRATGYYIRRGNILLVEQEAFERLARFKKAAGLLVVWSKATCLVVYLTANLSTISRLPAHPTQKYIHTYKHTHRH